MQQVWNVYPVTCYRVKTAGHHDGKEKREAFSLAKAQESLISDSGSLTGGDLVSTRMVEAMVAGRGAAGPVKKRQAS
ncbi:putative polyketide synthase protein [Desulfovibrio ferrophilus]|uniref:Putative polyketide synthase protein n=1 Tax=Desulfovibrio ferrophilus TaxID=241368 RepID=A0A2Z6AWT6_9BACT|nr:putative polyketide synthase protein [Desulfovibrio ferrophilus]